MIYEVDQSFGRIVAALEKKQMLRETLIIVVSDNGGAANGYDGSIGSNWPLKGVTILDSAL